MNPTLPKRTQPAACLNESNLEKTDRDDPITNEADQCLQVSQSTEDRHSRVPTTEKPSFIANNERSSEDKETTNHNYFEDGNLKSNDTLVASVSENVVLGAASCIDCTGEDFEFHLQESILLAYQHPLFKIEEEVQEFYESNHKANTTKSEFSDDSMRKKRTEERDRRRRSLGKSKWSTEANYDSDESSLSLSDVESEDLQNDLNGEENFKLSEASGVDKNGVYQEEKSENNNDMFTKDSSDSDDSDIILPSNGVQQHDYNKELVFDIDKYPETQGFRIEEAIDGSVICLGFLSCNNSEEISLVQGTSENSSETEANQLSLTETHVENNISENINKTADFNVTIEVSESGHVDCLSDNCSSLSDNSSTDDVTNSKSDHYGAKKKEVLSSTNAKSTHIKGTKNRESKKDSERMDQKQSNKFDYDDPADNISDNEEKAMKASHEIRNQTPSQIDRYENQTGKKKDAISYKNKNLNTGPGMQNSTHITGGGTDQSNECYKSSYDFEEYPYTPRSSVSGHPGDEVYDEDQEEGEGGDAIDDFVNDDDIVSHMNEKNVDKSKSNEPYDCPPIEYK